MEKTYSNIIENSLYNEVKTIILSESKMGSILGKPVSFIKRLHTTKYNGETGDLERYHKDETINGEIIELINDDPSSVPIMVVKYDGGIAHIMYERGKKRFIEGESSFLYEYVPETEKDKRIFDLFAINFYNEEVENDLNESKTKGHEVYHITCEGEPIDSFESEEIAMKHLDIYKKKHPEKEFIIEKKTYDSPSEMIDKLDEMSGDEDEIKENKKMKKVKVTSLAEAAFLAKQKNYDKFKFNGKEYNLNEYWEFLKKEETMCEECKGTTDKTHMKKNRKKINEGLTEKGVGKVQQWCETLGCRETAIKLVDIVLDKMVGLRSSDLSDTLIFADGLDEIETLLEDGEYQGAFNFAKETAKSMLDDEGYSMDIDEKLIGKQSKLDKNKNGKIDSDDFKILRSKKDMDEKKETCNECGSGKIRESKKEKLRLTESELISLIEKMVKKTKLKMNESKDEKIELFYVMNSKGQVKNISKKESDAENFLEKSLKGDGKIKSKTVYKKDYDDEKVTVSTIKNYTLNESSPGLQITNRVKNVSKKENDNHIKNVEKKLKNISTFDGNDNPEFPKQIGKGEKMAINNTEKQNEIVHDNRGGGMEDLNYDYEPSEKFKNRLKMALKGDPKMGNSQDAANVIKTKTGEKLEKKVERKKGNQSKEFEVSWGHDWKSPQKVEIVKENLVGEKNVINEEIERMKRIINYEDKTQ